MVGHCVVNTCSTTYRSRGRIIDPEGVKVHRFPSGAARLNTWINNIRAVNGPTWLPPKVNISRVCSLHFTPSAYELERKDGVVKLKWNAAPTVFLVSKDDVPPNLPAPPADRAIRNDHLYSVAREEATIQDQRNARRKVLESIMNAGTPGGFVCAPSQEPPPLCRIQCTKTVRPESPMEDDTVRFPTLRDETAEVIDLDEDSNDSIQEVSTPKVQQPPSKGVNTCLINGNLLVAIPEGLRSQILTTTPSAQQILTDSEVDKLQIKRLTDENRKLQEELNKVRGFAERLLRQHERLRQQHRVTTRAYNKIKRDKKRANENLNNPFSDDESVSNSRWNQDSDEEFEVLKQAMVSRTKSGTVTCKRVPNSLVKPPQAAVQKQKSPEAKGGNIVKLLVSDRPVERSEHDSAPSACYVIRAIVNE